jgi:hypothetical protein
MKIVLENHRGQSKFSPASHLVQFEKSWHGLNLEEPEKTNEELMKFIG